MSWSGGLDTYYFVLSNPVNRGFYLLVRSDRSTAECIVNIVTCLPFFTAAAWTVKQKDLHPRDRAKVAAGMATVGVAATLYHLAHDSPRWRNVCSALGARVFSSRNASNSKYFPCA